MFTSVLPDGIRDTMLWSEDLSSLIGLKAIDRDVYDAIPADALIAVAIGLDGKTMAAQFDKMLASLPEDARARAGW